MSCGTYLENPYILYVASGGTIYAINTLENLTVRTIVVTPYDTINGIVFLPDGSKAYASHGDTVSVINTATSAESSTIPVTGAYGLVMASNGLNAYVTGVVNIPGTHRTLYAIHTDIDAADDLGVDLFSGSAANFHSALYNQRYFYVFDGGDSLNFVDVLPGGAIGGSSTIASYVGLAVTPSGKYSIDSGLSVVFFPGNDYFSYNAKIFDITEQASAIATSLDGSIGCVVGQQGLTVFNTTTKQITKTISLILSYAPDSVAITPDNSRSYIFSSTSSTFYVVDLASGETCSSFVFGASGLNVPVFMQPCTVNSIKLLNGIYSPSIIIQSMKSANCECSQSIFQSAGITLTDQEKCLCDLEASQVDNANLQNQLTVCQTDKANLQTQLATCQAELKRVACGTDSCANLQLQLDAANVQISAYQTELSRVACGTDSCTNLQLQLDAIMQERDKALADLAALHCGTDSCANLQLQLDAANVQISAYQTELSRVACGTDSCANLQQQLDAVKQERDKALTDLAALHCGTDFCANLQQLLDDAHEQIGEYQAELKRVACGTDSCTNLQQQLDDAHAQIATCQAELSRVSCGTDSCTHLQQQLDAANKQIAAYQAELSRVACGTDSCTSLRQLLDAANAQIANYQAQIAALNCGTDSCTNLQLQLDAIMQERDKALADLTALNCGTDSCANLQQQLAASLADLALSQKEKADLQAQLDTCISDKTDLQAQLGTCKYEIDRVACGSDSCMNLQQQLDMANTQIGHLTTLLDELCGAGSWGTQCKTRDDIILSLQNQLDACVNEKTDLQAQLTQCQAELKRVSCGTDSCANLQQQLTTCQNMLNACQKERDDFYTQLTQCQAELSRVACGTDSCANMQQQLDAANVQIAAYQTELSRVACGTDSCTILQQQLDAANKQIEGMLHDLCGTESDSTKCRDAIAKLNNDLVVCDEEKQNLKDQLQSICGTHGTMCQDIMYQALACCDDTPYPLPPTDFYQNNIRGLIDAITQGKPVSYSGAHDPQSLLGFDASASYILFKTLTFSTEFHLSHRNKDYHFQVQLGHMDPCMGTTGAIKCWSGERPIHGIIISHNRIFVLFDSKVVGIDQNGTNYQIIVDNGLILKQPG